MLKKSLSTDIVFQQFAVLPAQAKGSGWFGGGAVTLGRTRGEKEITEGFRSISPAFGVDVGILHCELKVVCLLMFCTKRVWVNKG